MAFVEEPREPEQYSHFVFGGGISGLVAARLLAGKSERPVLLIDEYDHLGGNHISVDIGSRSFDIGSFFFQDDSPLMKHFPEILNLYQDIGGYLIQKLTPAGRTPRITSLMAASEMNPAP